MADTRRDQIVEIIRAATEPITGGELAARLGVSRQVIVQDMAILRAAGEPILATPRGYLAAPSASGKAPFREVLAVQHTRDQIEAELTALVDLGIRVVDVVVDHPVYGELRGLLMIESRADVRHFLQRLEGAEPLMALTRGVHLHTVESSRRGAIEEGRQALSQLGILLGDAASIDKTAV
jgi:transcriptional regulator of NAD metabolism